jgi:hypothetical protein
VQRIYAGNVTSGEHKIDVSITGKLQGGADYNQTGSFAFQKGVEPELVGLTLAGPDSGRPAIEIGDW